jgi:AhpD family alkylhydroperoxidase
VSAPRIPPGGRKEVGAFAWTLSHAAGKAARTEPMKLFLTLGRHRKLFRGWLRFAGRLMPRGTLPRRDTELVILRVAHLRSCDYELVHHKRLGRRAGLSDEELTRVAEGSSTPGWTDRDRALLAAAEALHRDGDMDDATWSALRAYLDEREAIELCMLAGHYEMLATVIAALRIEPDMPRR